MKNYIRLMFAHGKRLPAAAICTSLVLISASTFAQTYHWDADNVTAGIQDGSGFWTRASTNANWSLVGDGSDDVPWVDGSDAVLGGGTSGTAGTITLVGSPVIHNITFNQPFAGSYALSSSTPFLTNGSVITVNNGGDCQLNSNLRGNNGFIKDGPGTLTMNTGTSNYYTGTVIVTNGTLIINTGTGKPTIDAGGLRVYTNGTFQYATGKSGLINVNASITNSGGVIQWGASETTASLVNFVLEGGLVTNNTPSDRTIIVSGSYLVQSGTFAFNPNIVSGVSTNAKAIILAGTAGMTKTTAGTVYILGNFNTATLGQSIKNTFTGITTIKEGKLNIGFDNALGVMPNTFAPNQLTLDGGALQVASGFTWGTNRGVTLTANGGTLDIMPSVSQTIRVPIAGAAGGSLTKANNGTLTFNTNNTYNGDTIISAGTLALSGNGSISNSPNITVAGGATFDVSALTTPLTLENSQTLTASGTTSTGTVATASSHSFALGTTSALKFTAYNGINPPLAVTGAGTFGVNAGNVVTVTVANGGTPLGTGDHTLISGSGSGGVVGTAPAAVTVNGDGIVGGATASLLISGSDLVLHVASATAAPATNSISISGTTATIGITGSPATSYVLQTTTNLVGAWIPIQTNTTDGSGVLIFTDLNATNQEQFYRTVH